MKNAIRLGTLSIAALVMGCIPLSLHPLYTEETQEFDPNLIGAWVALDGDSETADGWFIVSADKATYRVVIREEGKANPMNGRLVRIGWRTRLKFCPFVRDFRSHQIGIPSYPLGPSLSVSTSHRNRRTSRTGVGQSTPGIDGRAGSLHRITLQPRQRGGHGPL